MIVIVCIATIIFVVGLIVVIIISNESYVYHLSCRYHRHLHRDAIRLG